MGLYDKRHPMTVVDRGGQVHDLTHPDFGGPSGTDWTDAFLECLEECVTEGGTAFIPVGDFEISDTAEVLATSNEFPGVSIIGAGPKSRLINKVAGGPCLRVHQSASANFNRHPVLANFAIVPPATSPPANSHGVEVGACIGLALRNLHIKDLSGDAIKTKQDLGDADLCGEVLVEGCQLLRNAGWGVNMTSLGAISGWEIVRNRLDANGGGILPTGYNGRILSNSIALCDTYPDVYFDYTAGLHPNGWEVINNWLEKGRVGAFLLEGLLNSRFAHNHIIYNDALSGAYGYRMGGAGASPAVQNVEFDSDRFVVTGAAAFKAYEFLASADHNRVVNPSFDTFSGYTKYDLGTSSNNIIIEQNKHLLAPMVGMADKTTGAATVTPDLLEGSFIRITRTATGAWTLNVPSNGLDTGRPIEVSITNASGGAITTTFGAGWLVGGYTDPANGKRRTVRCMYDPNSLALVQIGAWSPDL